MATSNQRKHPMLKTLRSKIKDDHLTCAICLEHFTNPKALPCLHTFCENCIREYIFGRNFDKLGKFPCPECNQEINIPDNGVEAFPDNFHVKSLLDTLATPVRPAPPAPRGNGSPIPMQIPCTAATESNLDPNQLYPTLQRSVSEQKDYEFVSGDGMILKFGQFGGTLTDFHKPYGLAIGHDGQFAVSDRSGSRILIYSNTGILLSRITCAQCKISGLCFLGDGNILVAVANAGSAIMRIYNMDGKLIENIGEYYRFSKPGDIAVSSKHHIVVSDLESHTIMVFTDQRKFSTKFGTKGSGEKRFLSPNFVAINRKDNIIVSDCGNNCIQVFDHLGNFKNKFGSEGNEHGFLLCPMGIATDSHNNIIVADAGNYRVEIFDKKGRHIKCLVEDTDLIGNESKPLNVAVTLNGDIAVLLVGEQFAEVQVFSWNG